MTDRDPGSTVSSEVATSRRWRDDLRLLHDRDLRLLIASRLISDLGTGIAPIALAFGVLTLPGADAGSLGVVLLAAALPRLVFMLFGGVLADRVDRARLMVAAELLAAIAQLVAAGLFLTGHATVPALAALAAVNGLAVALFFPSMTGLLPQVAQGDDLQSANALVRLSTNVAMILGTALGGVLVATLGPGWALLVDGLTYAMSAALLAFVRVRSAERADPSTSMLADLRHGWREFSSRRWVWLVVVLFSLMNIGFGAAIGVLGPVQALESWGGATGWAIVLASFSAGTVVGVLLAMRLRPGRPMLVAMLVCPLLAVPIALMAPPAAVWVVAVFAFVAGVAVDVFEVLWQTALQQNIPQESLSRVSAYDWFGSTAFTPLAFAATGFAVAAVGVETSIWVCAGLASLGVVGVLDPQVRGLRAGGPEPAADSLT